MADDDDQPRVARAGRRAQAGRRAGPQEEESQEPWPPSTAVDATSGDASSDQNGSSRRECLNDGVADDAVPTSIREGGDNNSTPSVAANLQRRTQGFVDGGGGGFMDSNAGGSSSFRSPEGPLPSRPPPPSGEGDEEGDSRKAFSGVSRRKAEQAVKVEEEKAVRNRRYDDMAVDGIMEIPELEEEGKEDLSRVVAEAPKVRTNRVQGINELEEDMQFRLPATDDRDIDLSALTSVLCSSDQVEEGDEVWEPDMLFTDVASELNREKERAEGETREEGSGAELEGNLLGQMCGGGVDGMQ